jgi:hypothetical protein
LKRSFLVLITLLAVVALAPQKARADEITVGGTTSATTPLGITFGLGSFNGTTSSGFAAFSNLGSFTLSSGPGIYTNSTVALTVVFTVPTGISGGGSTSFVASVFGNVNTNAQGGVDIVFTNPSQTFAFVNATGSGSFTFNLNNVSVGPGLTTPLSGYVTGGSVTPVSAPEPSTALFLGVGLLLTPILKRKILG